MSTSPWNDPPLSRAPLDYVPVSKVHKPRRAIKRAVIAAAITAAITALFAFPRLGLVAIALGVMVASVWSGDKLADRMDGKATSSIWLPDPFSWWPTVIAALIFATAIYFI